MIFGFLLLLTGITLSAVAIYYSVIGLTAIFAAAFWPIVIMGTTLEVSKLVAASWLKHYWSQIPRLMKIYMTISVLVLMLITSMGIFGFLSKAHLDQTVPTGDVASQVALFDEKINNERETIANARTLIGQLDKAVSDISSMPDREVNGRVISSAERALQVRRQQARDRAALTKTIEDAQARIVKLQEEKAPIASQLRAVEAEVGPIKYIAKLIYGDNPDQNILEKAVTWVIIIIIFVFDPLAVLMILAAQMTFSWSREQKTSARIPPAAEKKIDDEPRDEEGYPEPQDTGYVHSPWPFPVGEVDTPSGDITSPEKFGLDRKEKPQIDIDNVNEKIREVDPEIDVDRILDTTGEKLITADNTEVTVNESKFQILPELQEESLKKKIHDQKAWEADSLGEEVTYVQNSEQNETSLWNRVRNHQYISDQFHPKDYLMVVYDQGNFEDFQYDADSDPELDKFIKEIKEGTYSFGDYPQEQLKIFASRIYELRKN
jgi:hypothetical protein